MANQQRGQVAFKAGEREFTLAFSINAMCELEDNLDLTINQIAAKVQNPAEMKMQYVRAIIWAALRNHHPEVDIIEAGKIASEAGVAKVMQAVQQCFKAAFPEPEAAKKADPKRAAKA